MALAHRDELRVASFQSSPCIPPQSSGPTRGVRNPQRLRAVAEAELRGHLGDQDLDAVVATLRLACGVPMAVINIVTADAQTYPAEVGVGAPCTLVPDRLSFCAEVVDTGRPLAVPDAVTHPVYSSNPMVLEGVIGAYAGVPLVDDGYVLGSVSIFDGNAREFSAEVLEILQYQARLAASVLALRRSARTDVLTGLPNRGLCLDRLDRALARLERHGGAVAVMYLDIDDFKGINDEWGHHVGDQVLIELAKRFSAILRPADTLARFGGDEFVTVCEDLETAQDATLMAERMLAVTAGPWHLDGISVNINVSIGVAVSNSPATDLADLLRDADEAMYVAKKTAGGYWVMAGARGDLHGVVAGGSGSLTLPPAGQFAQPYR